MNAYHYVKQMMESEYFHCQWYLLWRKPDSYFELVLQCPLENKHCRKLIDSNLQTLDETEFLYQFSLIFYNQSKVFVDKEDALVSFPIDIINGIRQGDVLAIVRYLKKLSGSVRIAWHEFLSSASEISEFALEWDEKEYQTIRRQLIEKKMYSFDRLYYMDQ